MALQTIPADRTGRQADGADTETRARAYSLGELINEQFDLAERCAEDHVTHVIECGRLLQKQQDRLNHGAWQPWLAEHCPKIAERTARHYTQAAKAAKTLNENGKPCRFASISALLDAARRLELEQLGAVDDVHQDGDGVHQENVEDDVHEEDVREDDVRDRSRRRREDRRWERFQNRHRHAMATADGVELFMANWRLLVQALHPDRAPAARRDEFEHATAVITQIRDIFASAASEKDAA